MNKQIITAISILVSAFALHAADVVVYPRTTGTPYPCPLPKTGQINSYAAEDDGNLQKGIAWPVTRFTVQANTNCVIDNLTGLMWARNANMWGVMNWGAAVTNCNNLNYGSYTDWRLPNWQELRSLIDASKFNPALPSEHPFAVVRSGYYWSSTTSAYDTGNAWFVFLFDGYVNDVTKVRAYYVWPVRGGY